MLKKIAPTFLTYRVFQVFERIIKSHCNLKRFWCQLMILAFKKRKIHSCLFYDIYLGAFKSLKRKVQYSHISGLIIVFILWIFYYQHAPLPNHARVLHFLQLFNRILIIKLLISLFIQYFVLKLRFHPQVFLTYVVLVHFLALHFHFKVK